MLGDQMTTLESKFPSNAIREAKASIFGIDGGGTGKLIVINRTDTLMFLWSKDYGKTIGGLVCLSSAYRTQDNLGVGSTLGEIRKKHPYVYLRPSYLNSAVEYLTVKYHNGSINFEVISPMGEQIGIYDPNSSDEPTTTEFDDDAVVNRLVIWK